MRKFEVRNGKEQEMAKKLKAIFGDNFKIEIKPAKIISSSGTKMEPGFNIIVEKIN